MNKITVFVLMIVGVVQAYAQPLPLDYSYVGYRMSEHQIPDADVKVYVPYKSSFQSARIQKAIDYVSQLKPDRKTGLRGAILLDAGDYILDRPLRIAKSGVVLRGQGRNNTFLHKKGFDRGAVVYIEGVDNRIGTDTFALDHQMVVGSKDLKFVSKLGTHRDLKVGDEVIIARSSTKEWIDLLNCSTFGGGQDLGYWGWHPGEVDLEWTRRLTNVEGNQVSLDAPLSMTLDKKWSDTHLIRYVWPGRIEDSGVENLSLISDYDTLHLKDEDHAWDGVYIANARNCWVRLVDFRHFSGSAVVIQRSGSQITVEDCTSKEPVSEIGGYRRRTFLTYGEKCLFQRLHSEDGINDFAAGFIAAGPNAFVQCESQRSLGFSGSVGSLATGLLYDDVNIDGNDLRFCNLGIEKYGTGWNTSNSLAYQCTASGIFADSLPDGSNNHVYGCWAQFCGTGDYQESNNHVKPWSIFAAQLEKRIGEKAALIARTHERNTDASSSPTFEEAQEMARRAHEPRITMDAWIDSARFTASTNADGVKNVDRINDFASVEQITPKEYNIVDGRLVVDGQLLVGGRHDSPWWNGRVKYSATQKAPYALTRFVPGMEQKGTTDRVDSVVATMQREGTVIYNQNYGLWYDRRRDDHERVRRRDGDVWGPFYEQVFARSGKGFAWDGLSKYDLERLNNWYFNRLTDFANKVSDKGIILKNQYYFQHNILEAGAHWVDCPWRTANNINHHEFPEPVPFTGDKRIFMADYFYDLNNSVIRGLHKQYIEKVLDVFADQPNVIHSIGEEFTGPYGFVEFWLQTIRDWEQQKGKHVLVSLAVNKNVQDSIMQLSDLNRVVDIIDIEQWFYNDRGLYAPEGGTNMAPRQYLRKIKVGGVRFKDVYRGVSECRKAYPNKAVLYSAQKYPEMCWAVLMAGGSCPVLPVKDRTFLTDVAKMNPNVISDGIYMMQNEKLGGLVYVDGADLSTAIKFPEGEYRLATIEPKTGRISIINDNLSIQDGYKVNTKGIYWLKRLK